MDELLTSREREVRDRVREFSDREVIPMINDYWEEAEFPFEIVPKLARLEVAGGTTKGYGCPGLSPMASGLVGMELARGDGSICTFYGVHSGLAMGSISILGSPAQKKRWLAPMAAFEKIGAFALTEPDHGSDSLLLETTARQERDRWVLNGRKKWIGNGSFADVLVVWARDEKGEVGGFVVERPAPGLSSEVMKGKISKRAVWQAELEFKNVEIPLENRLEGSDSFADTARVLTATRYGVAWEALGHSVACYEAALEYAQSRTQFGKPLAGFQLVQNKLARMLSEITAMQLLCWRLSGLAAARRLTPGMASLAKMNNARKARWVAATARDILGGNGILLDNHVARHQADMEAVFTYEGTDSIQALIIGKEITGTQAFA
ncbi:MAG TPA: acyl-CoA dehydrogenase family protein [Candidatus Dormibacteraeota bacterium]